MNRWRTKLDECKAAIAEHFDESRDADEVVTVEGMAKRVRRRSYIVDPLRRDDLQALLGERYGEVIDESETLVVREDRAADLMKKLGAQRSNFIRSEPILKLKRKFIEILKGNTRDPHGLVEKAAGAIDVKVSESITFVEPHA